MNFYMYNFYMINRKPVDFQKAMQSLEGYAYISNYYKDFAGTLDISNGSNILDFGCGGGLTLRHIAPLNKSGNITGFDISLTAIVRARDRMKRYRNVKFINNYNDLIGKTGVYDLVFMHFVLHDIPEDDRQNVFIILKKVMKSTGTLILREPSDLKHGIKKSKILEYAKNSGFKLSSKFTGKVKVYTKYNQMVFSFK